ncbi:MAG: PilN domain-containing protein [Phycisphaeraceae bacterium]|nr:PilN domain-containing protein [Phycisphaeraceae bacterium]
MSQIDFLPETFQRAHRRQQRRPLEFLVIAGTLVALAGLWLSTSGPDSALANQAEQLDQNLEEIAQLRSEQGRLFRERSGLQRKLMTARETYQPISATQVISRLSSLTPESIRLVNFEIVAQRPAPQARPRPSGSKKVVSKKRADQPADPNLMKLTITGHAPSDEQLVTLIRRMDGDPVFTSVSLRSSKQDKTKTHYVRTFHLDVVIDLDRRFVEAGGGNHHAD